MANDWLRLWHDMPTDPKWRTVARISKQPISLVISVYICLLVDASRNVTRGHATVTHEDLASQLDVTEDEIHAVLSAMNGRVIDENLYLTGWEKRQPKKEDSGNQNGAKPSSERKSEQREHEKIASENAERLMCHDMSHEVTIDTDTDKSKPISSTIVELVAGKPVTVACPHQKIIEIFGQLLPMLPQPVVWDGQRAKNLAARWRWVLTAKKRDGARYATDSESALNFFTRYFLYVSKSDFLTGRNGKWQNCDLGWLVKSENFAKVLSGNYENQEEAA